MRITSSSIPSRSALATPIQQAQPRSTNTSLPASPPAQTAERARLMPTLPRDEIVISRYGRLASERFTAQQRFSELQSGTSQILAAENNPGTRAGAPSTMPTAASASNREKAIAAYTRTQSLLFNTGA